MDTPAEPIIDDRVTTERKHDVAAHGAVRDGPPIAFTAGFDPKRYRSLKIRTVLWGLVFVGAPLAGLLLTGEVKPFLLLVAAVFVTWPLWLMIQKNAPRRYDPAKPPKELVG